MLRLAVSALTLTLASAGAATAQPLDELITFDDPYHCAPGAQFGALLDSVIRWEQAGDAYKGSIGTLAAPAAFASQAGQPTLAVDGNEYKATVPLRGTWRGLPLRSLVVVQWVESEGGFYLVFDAPPEQVRKAALDAGFRLPPTGGEYRDEGVLGVYVGVDAYEGTGALHCIAG